MVYLPTRCQRCGDVSLREATECRGGEVQCLACSGEANVLPGCAYLESDLAVFNELRSYVDDACLSPGAAAELLSLLDDVGGREQAVRAMGALVKRIPRLDRMQGLLLASPSNLRQALSILVTLLNACLMSRNSSTMALAPPSAKYSSSSG